MSLSAFDLIVSPPDFSSIKPTAHIGYTSQKVDRLRYTWAR
jgi:hypothetical protein